MPELPQIAVIACGGFKKQNVLLQLNLSKKPIEKELTLFKAKLSQKMVFQLKDLSARFKNKKLNKKLKKLQIC